jgi:ADP-ribose pyrophosphatase
VPGLDDVADDAEQRRLVVNDQDQVLMLWRYRFATEQWGYELLGGLVEEGEAPSDTAAREIEEESGWRPIGEPEHLISFEPCQAR